MTTTKQEMTQFVGQLKEAMKKAPPVNGKPAKWKFTIVRDADGKMKEVLAEAQKD